MVRIDPSCLGSPLLLAEISEAYEYKDGKRSSQPIGYKYACICSGLRFEKLNILIPGSLQINEEYLGSSEELLNVAFEGLEIVPYVVNGNFGLKATAKRIYIIDVD